MLAREWLLPSRTMKRRIGPTAIGLAYIASISLLGGLRPGTAEPVRGAGVELGGFPRLHDEVVLAEPQPQPAGQHVHPLISLVALLVAFGLTRRDGHL